VLGFTPTLAQSGVATQLLNLQPLHDEECKNGDVASQPKLHLQQTRPFFGPEPYKHPKNHQIKP
jgi:hypothetical protein